MAEQENGTPPDQEQTSDLIQETLAPLLDRREELAEEYERLKTEASEKQAEIKKVDRLLTIGGLVEQPPPYQGGRKHRHRYKQRQSYISGGMLEHAKDNIPDEEFTIKMLAERMDVTETTAKKAIDELRDAGELRLLGLKPLGDGPHKALHYKKVTVNA